MKLNAKHMVRLRRFLDNWNEGLKEHPDRQSKNAFRGDINAIQYAYQTLARLQQGKG